MNIAEVRKMIGAAIGGAITWAYTALADDSIDKLEWIGLIGVVATAFGVYQVPNQVRKVAKKMGVAKKAAPRGGD